jgi:DNA-binding NarL/FixJ family response regulator
MTANEPARTVRWGLPLRRVAAEGSHSYDSCVIEPVRQQSLSPRELQVLEMAAEGLTNHQMATKLEITVHAVKFHLASIYRKLGVANRTEAAVKFLRLESAGQKGAS